jgi:hypothetical protein
MLKGIYSRTTHYIQVHILDAKIVKYFEWHIPWDSCSARGHWKMNFALLFSWDVTSTIDHVPAINSNSGMFSHPLQFLELGNYFAIAMLLLSSHQLETWVHYLPTASFEQCRYELILWEITSTKDSTLTYPEQVIMSWDPGGLGTVPDVMTSINRKSIHLSFSHLTWDPGGYISA